MNTPYPFVPAEKQTDKLAYVRQIAREALPAELQAQVPDDAQIWGIHDAQGKCLALTANRGLAFSMARQNDLAPVSVH